MIRYWSSRVCRKLQCWNRYWEFWIDNDILLWVKYRHGVGTYYAFRWFRYFKFLACIPSASATVTHKVNKMSALHFLDENGTKRILNVKVILFLKSRIFDKSLKNVFRRHFWILLLMLKKYAKVERVWG